VRNDRRVRLTPLGRAVLQAAAQGRVSYRTREQIVIWRQAQGQICDVSSPFVELRGLGFIYIQPYDPDRLPQPVEVPCLVTPAGENALMEAAQAARKRKAGKR
jgi:hypothetical protein